MNTPEEEFGIGEHPGLPTIEALAKEIKPNKAKKLKQKVTRNRKRDARPSKQEGPEVKARIRLRFLGDVGIVLSLPLALLGSLGTLIPCHRKNHPPDLPSG